MDKSSPTDWVMITAWATIVLDIAALVTAYIAYWAARNQNKVSAESLGVDLVLRFDDRFNSRHIQEQRQEVIRSITDRNPNFQPVLDFFETIGHLTRRGVLDKELVYSTFFHWVHHYRFLANDYLEEERAHDPTLWVDFLFLHETLLPLEQERQRPGWSSIPTNEDLNSFMDEELHLLTFPPA